MPGIQAAPPGDGDEKCSDGSIINRVTGNVQPVRMFPDQVCDNILIRREETTGEGGQGGVLYGAATTRRFTASPCRWTTNGSAVAARGAGMFPLKPPDLPLDFRCVREGRGGCDKLGSAKETRPYPKR